MKGMYALGIAWIYVLFLDIYNSRGVRLERAEKEENDSSVTTHSRNNKSKYESKAWKNKKKKTQRNSFVEYDLRVAYHFFPS